MEILVTGGAGYLGSVLVPRLLRAGHRVRVLDALMFGDEGLAAVAADPGLERVHGDVRHPGCLARAAEGMETVIHLAALVGEPACAVDPALAEAVNFSATCAALAAARAAGARRFLFASTCSNYGRQDRIADEDDELHPLSLYAETKVRAEGAVRSASAPPFAACVVRLATLHGLAPRMRFNLLVNQLVREAVLTRTVSLYGSDAWRPYIHVQDAARAFGVLAEAPVELLAGQVYNVGADNARKTEVVDLIREHVPDLRVRAASRPADARDYRVSFGKFGRSLRFVAERSLQSGIAEMCRALEDGVFEDPFDPRLDAWIDEERLAQALDAARGYSGR